MVYIPTIGLEIHAELNTKTKMFCNSRNDPDCKEPNMNICPVCMAHPGTLPVINREAVRMVLLVGLALGGKLADYTEFDRKHYFYPDLPKGYQISQYKFPLVQGGSLCGVDVTRVHLEEDTARSMHTLNNDGLLDFNRAGIPLMELVTEPIIHDSAKAVMFARELQLLLRYLHVSLANMDKGEMRVEANVSLYNDQKKKDDKTMLGTKVEVKNLNSIRAVKLAIDYEVERQSKILDKGEKILQETRGWDEAGGKTVSQRIKEESHDYRYFPDPDLPKLIISQIPEFAQNILMEQMPELPSTKRERYKKEHGLNEQVIESIITDIELSRFFDQVVDVLQNDKDAILRAGNYISSDIAGLIKESANSLEIIERIGIENFAELMCLLTRNILSSRGAKDILSNMAQSGGNPNDLMVSMGLKQVSDDRAIIEIVKKIIIEQSVAVEDYRAGKSASLQFLVGQGMKKSRGSANPETLRQVLISILDSA
jgi:aspartyl-tRNA(Asn)/glutamyl-tRNA(Gln) amidotransferase subunit B